MVLIRLSLPIGDDASRCGHIKEFAAETLEEAVGKAMDWNTVRHERASTPTIDLSIERWVPAENRWASLG